MIASVRGMGVAVITSTSGATFRPLDNAARWSTPNLCCSSMTTSPRRGGGVFSCRSACVPTRMSGCHPSGTSGTVATRPRGSSLRAGAGAVFPGRHKHPFPGQDPFVRAKDPESFVGLLREVKLRRDGEETPPGEDSGLSAWKNSFVGTGSPCRADKSSCLAGESNSR